MSERLFPRVRAPRAVTSGNSRSDSRVSAKSVRRDRTSARAGAHECSEDANHEWRVRLLRQCHSEVMYVIPREWRETEFRIHMKGISSVQDTKDHS